jgi:hypothetical protein
MCSPVGVSLLLGVALLQNGAVRVIVCLRAETALGEKSFGVILGRLAAFFSLIFHSTYSVNEVIHSSGVDDAD